MRHSFGVCITQILSSHLQKLNKAARVFHPILKLHTNNAPCTRITDNVSAYMIISSVIYSKYHDNMSAY